ncbi:MAG: ACT domain-containing protein [Desulfopila sp.]|nr:ACT domain-containing protein [Desulfopila sp.]
MNTTLITTVTGPDSLGIIKSLAEATRGLGGEWISSKVMKLDGRFAALMKVIIEESKEAQLREELDRQFPELDFSYAEPRDSGGVPLTIINLEIDCKDRPGLTKDINTILSNLDLTVENMEFNRMHVSSIGEAVFNAKLALAVPEGTSSESLADEIESLSDDVRVNVV